MKSNKYSNLIIKNPKRTGADTKSGRASWYPYYAGFSPDFAQGLLSSAKLTGDATVLDPWNGGGTTTASASVLGIGSIGSDLNPVMIIAAKAYMLNPRGRNSLQPLANDICTKAIRSKQPLATSEPLLTWFSDASALFIRRLERAIQHLLVIEGAYLHLDNGRAVEELSDIASFFFVALFRTTRQLLKSFYSSNPTWLKKPKEDMPKITIDSAVITSMFKAEVGSMSDFIGSSDAGAYEAKSSLFVSPSEQLPVESESADFILTSPPYCTRIDYAIATMAELSVLGIDLGKDFKALRKSLTGTSAISNKNITVKKEWGPECNRFIEQVESHTSVSSISYYKKNHLQYFDSIFCSISEIERVMKPSTLCSVVIQDSYYKDVHNDVPKIFSEMAKSYGLSIVRQDDFRMNQTMAGINPEVRKYRKQVDAKESVLTFIK